MTLAALVNIFCAAGPTTRSSIPSVAPYASARSIFLARTWCLEERTTHTFLPEGTSCQPYPPALQRPQTGSRA
ncbi:hypothetical protein CALVIDRAFT_538412 [Calocera viscosa TUFC12733]|uniref:Uncharacterized protein n=1 Tax=Calocera viscosa (strain TUFC12733) TaxID=1330018 RepID=A0A167L2H2_CALVF|nr:hypothetical protein CALVIDRAFT_538412 [Calocera viscosa TUFC12733]